MAQLIVRNLDDDIVERLKARASANHRSTEEEHRLLLRDALRPESETLKAMISQIPDVGDDADFARSEDSGRDVEL